MFTVFDEIQNMLVGGRVAGRADFIFLGVVEFGNLFDHLGGRQLFPFFVMEIIIRKFEVSAAEAADDVAIDLGEWQVADKLLEQPGRGFRAAGGIFLPFLIALFGCDEFVPVGEERKIRQNWVLYRRLHLFRDSGDGLPHFVEERRVAAQEQTRVEASVGGITVRRDTHHLAGPIDDFGIGLKARSAGPSARAIFALSSPANIRSV
jgi:hypothetical protein